ncbi:MAG: hypothetical protein ACKVX9_15535 [Blastocatellia bacterium]
MRQTAAPKRESGEPGEEREYPYWNRVYATVVVFAITVITLIWAFSRMFE